MMHPLRRFLQEVGDHLQSPAMAQRVQGDWAYAFSQPRASLEPPATKSELIMLEDQIGQPLPATLLEVLGQVSRNIEIVWVMRGSYVPAAWGGETVDITVDVPDAFREWDRGLMPDGTLPEGATRKPKYISGGLRFSIDGIIGAAENLRGWMDIYDADRTVNAADAAHFKLITGFMSAGLPVLTAPNGDWLAIDLRDDAECLMHVSHEGEEAGIEIDLTLPQFLAHLAWLGPMWPDFLQIFGFSESVENVVPDDPRITRAQFDADGTYGRAWRKWFWGDTSLQPDPSLLRRCNGSHLRS